MCEPFAMFHVELRRSQERVCRFNMTEQTLMDSVLIPWAGGESIELGERIWRPEETAVTVLEGPEIPIGGLTMSRGWPTAMRQGKDVTRAVVASVRKSLVEGESATMTEKAGAENGVGGASAAGGGEDAGSGRGATDEVLADAFGLELMRNLSSGAITLHAVWRLAGERHPELEASGSLQLAMSAVISLLRSGLVTLCEVGTGEALGSEIRELEARAMAMDGWLTEAGRVALEIRRA